MSFRGLSIFCAMAMATIACSGCASTGDWSMPFTGSSVDGSANVQQASYEDGEGWSVYSPLNTGMNTLKAGGVKIQQGTAQLTSGTGKVMRNTMNYTSSAWTTTKSVLTPPMFKPGPNGEPSTWDVMTTPEPEYTPPRTVNDFLSQDRPR